MIESGKAGENGWISVKERMPDHDFPVLTVNNHEVIQLYVYFNGDWYDGYCTTLRERNAKWVGRLEPITITYWQPLPALPQPAAPPVTSRSESVHSSR